MCLYTYVLSHEWKVSAFIAKSTPDVFVDFRPPYWWTKVVHQHGDSIQNSTKLRATLRQITQKRCITQTWDLERLFMYKSSTTFSCSWLFSLNGFEFIFLWRDSEKRSIARGILRSRKSTITFLHLVWCENWNGIPPELREQRKALFNHLLPKVLETGRRRNVCRAEF